MIKNKQMKVALLVVFLVILAIAVGVISWWVIVSYTTFPRRFKPGDKYKVATHELTIPDLPHKQYRSSRKPSRDDPVLALDQETLNDIHGLLKNTMEGLRKLDMPFYVTGGTLIGAVLWNGLMIYDDDLDMTVMWEDRSKLWGQTFVDEMDKLGLEVFYLRGSSENFATREGGAVRLRWKGKVFPTCDIFVTKEYPMDKYAKVDGWSGNSITYNTKEVWEKDWIFPLQTKTICGLEWSLPNKPHKLLTKQYGDQWQHTIQSPHPMLSHRWAFHVTSMFSAWRVGVPTAHQLPNTQTIK